LGSVIKNKNQYVVVVDGKPIENTDSLHRRVKKSIHFIPVLGGAALFIPVFIKAVASVAAYLAKYWAWYAAAGETVQIAIAALIVIGGYALISIGISRLVESIMGGGEGTAITTSSYMFHGPQNVASQGDPVPIAYGRLMVGSKIISVSMSSGDKSKTGWLGNTPNLSEGGPNNANITRNTQGGIMATSRALQ
jgi:predicted phage tail protein